MTSLVPYDQQRDGNPSYLSPGSDVTPAPNDRSTFVTSLSNMTSPDVTYHEPSIAWLIMVPLVVGTITTITVIGNAMVMVAYWKDKRIHGRVASLLILNLAISDFIIGLVVLSVNLCWITWNELMGGEFWLLGEVFCKIWLVVDNTATMLSVFTIILISLDRYWLLTKKMHYQTFQTRKRVLITISLLWISTAFVYTLLAVGWPYFTGERNVDFTEECELDMAYNVYATTVQLFCEFIIPLTIIIILNIAVYIKIRNRAKGLKVHSKSSKQESRAIPLESNQRSSPVVSEASVSNINLVFPPSSPHFQNLDESTRVLESTFVNHANSVDDYQTIQRDNNSTPNRTVADTRKSRREFARHLRAAIVLAVLVSVFIACWLPYQIVNIINAICDECVSELVWEIVNNILWCNSFINPFLYAATNVHFRRNFIIFLGLRKYGCIKDTMQAAARPSSTAEQRCHTKKR